MNNSQGIVIYAGAILTCQRDALVSLTGPEALSEEAVPVPPEPTNDRARA